MSSQTTILVADDESTVREIVRKYLEKDGFVVIEAMTGPQTLQMLYENRPDLLILDVMLPGLDGFTLMRSLRDPVEKPSADPLTPVPVIMLTARTAEHDRLLGFELGADDYVVKPFSPRELVMRVKAVLRRGASGLAEAKAAEPEVLTYGDLRLESATRLVTRGGQEINLTAKEFELLWVMASHPRQVFTRTQLLDQVWGYEFYGDESTVTVHIHRLREKIEEDPTKPVYIQTVWGVGYKFEAG